MDLKDRCIKDYKEVFWTFEAGRAIEITWTKWPVARNSGSFRRLMRTPAGRTAFCVFNGCLRIVARGRTDGLLVVKGRPITVEDIEVETNIPTAAVKAGLALLASSEIGWIITTAEQHRLREARKSPGSDRGLPGADNGPQPAETPGEPRNPLAGARSESGSGSGSWTSPEGGAGETDRLASLDRVNGKPPPGLSGNWTHFELERAVAPYPKRCKPIRAREAVDRACCRLLERGVKDPLGYLEGRVRAYAAAVDLWPKAERRWVPDPHNWFDAGSYDDDPETWKRAPRGHDDMPTTAVGKGGF